MKVSVEEPSSIAEAQRFISDVSHHETPPIETLAEASADQRIQEENTDRKDFLFDMLRKANEKPIE